MRNHLIFLESSSKEQYWEVMIDENNPLDWIKFHGWTVESATKVSFEEKSWRIHNLNKEEGYSLIHLNHWFWSKSSGWGVFDPDSAEIAFFAYESWS